MTAQKPTDGATAAAEAATLLAGPDEGKPLWSRGNARSVGAFALCAVAVAGIGVLLMEHLPGERRLIGFSLYSCPSHMLISPLPHEPALFHVAKFYAPLTVALAATVGCCLAGLFDYWLLGPLLQSPWVRRKVRQTTTLQKSVTLFNRSPFWMLVVAGYTPLPFYPFKMLAILGRYPIPKYQLALIVGRFPRFYTFAWLGFVMLPPDWVLVAVALLGVAAFALKSTRVRIPWRRRPRPAQQPAAGSSSGAPLP